jgi:hypothetical protein
MAQRTRKLLGCHVSRVGNGEGVYAESRNCSVCWTDPGGGRGSVKFAGTMVVRQVQVTLPLVPGTRAIIGRMSPYNIRSQTCP